VACPGSSDDGSDLVEGHGEHVVQHEREPLGRGQRVEYHELDPNGHQQGMTGPVSYWHVDDINQRLHQLLDEGAQAPQASEMSAGASWSPR
jgi:hypothetical protein